MPNPFTVFFFNFEAGLTKFPRLFLDSLYCLSGLQAFHHPASASCVLEITDLGLHAQLILNTLSRL